MEVILIRHGKTKGNLEGRYVGRTDEELLESEKAELTEELERKYRDYRPDIIYSSRMMRCRQTANILFPGREICLWDGLEETDFGAFEYKNYEELNGNPAYQAWIDSGGTLAFPGGESGVDFRKRCCRAFVSCVQDAKKKGFEKIAIVAHGGTIMSIMEAYGVPKADFYSWQVKNGCGYRGEIIESEDEEDGIWKICIRNG